MRTPILIINFKNYPEASGEKALELSRDAANVSKELGVEIVLAPPTPSLAIVSRSVNISVIAQHVGIEKPGSTTGAIVAEMVKDVGGVGSIVNHSENRISQSVIEHTVNRLKELDMYSVVCARTPEEVNHLSTTGPDFVAIEPPELIGSGIAVSKSRPEIVTDSVSASKKANSKVRVLCGAGIVTGEDVAAAMGLGASGVLVASGIVKADDRLGKIRELAERLV